MAKVLIKSEKITPFGGKFHVREQFPRFVGLVIDKMPRRSQVPGGVANSVEDEEVEECLTERFAKHESIMNRNALHAFGLLLSRFRISRLLKRLSEDGLLIRKGMGAQTCYRPTPDYFGR